MTAYTIRVGYNSGFSKDEVGEELLKVVKELRTDRKKLTAEVKRLEPELADDETLEQYQESYDPDGTDLTIQVEKEKGLPLVMQCASGGGDSRDIKEAFRRAFCRLVLEAMHRKKMEVSIHVS